MYQVMGKDGARGGNSSPGEKLLIALCTGNKTEGQEPGSHQAEFGKGQDRNGSVGEQVGSCHMPL